MSDGVNGGYTNSMNVIGHGSVCNAFIDCDNLVTRLTSQKTSYLEGDKVTTSQQKYTPYQDQDIKTYESPYYYTPLCPKTQPLQDDYWPSDSGLDQYQDCPSSLHDIQSRKTDDAGQVKYSTYLCSANTGKMFFGQTSTQNIYKVDSSMNSPDNPQSLQFTPILTCDTQLWDGQLVTLSPELCYTEDNKNLLMTYVNDFATKKFIASTSSTLYSFRNGNDVYQDINGFLTPRTKKVEEGMIVRVADGESEMRKTSDIIRDNEQLLFFDRDGFGSSSGNNRFSAMWYNKTDGFNGIQFVYDQGHCGDDSTCDPNGNVYVTPTIRWTLILLDGEDDATRAVESLTNTKYLFENREFILQKTSTDIEGWYVDVSDFTTTKYLSANTQDRNQAAKLQLQAF